MLQDLVHNIDLENCAKNFFLSKISDSLDKDGQLMAHIVDTGEYFGGFVAKKKHKKKKSKSQPQDASNRVIHRCYDEDFEHVG